MEFLNESNCLLFEPFPENTNMTADILNSTITLDVKIVNETTEAAGFGTISGILLTFFIYLMFSFEYESKEEPIIKINLDDAISARNVSRAMVLIILLLILPIIVTFLILAFLYKNLCSIIIKMKDIHFVRFLDSFDVFWCLEDESSKNIINVLGKIQSESSEELVENIKNKLQSLISGEVEKIFYRRNEKFGFYYWRKYDIIDLNQYVEIVDHAIQNENNKADLEKFMSSLTNRHLPYNNEGLFQIVITKHSVDKENNYGIIFRIHHSVGDGVALIKLLCDNLADDTDVKPKVFSNKTGLNESFKIETILHIIQKLWQMVKCFIDGVLRQPDQNSLHGPSLNGNKLYKWTDADEDLLEKIREIKTNVDSIRFSDVLAASLSSGLQNFFSKTNTPVPDDVAVVIPVRFSDGHKLANGFSVTILDLPVKYSDIRNVQKCCNKLRLSADPLTNYYFLKIVSSVLPKYVLQPLLHSSQATMIFSNMPGPEYLSICGGNAIKSLVFFVPHKGNMGLGISALSYGGVLRFGVVADEALVPKAEYLDHILDGMVNEVNRLCDNLKYGKL